MACAEPSSSWPPYAPWPEILEISDILEIYRGVEFYFGMELKEIVSGIDALFSELVVVAGLLGQSALRSDPALLDEADTILPRVRRLGDDLCRELSKSAASEPAALKYISIPGHVERVCDHFEDASRLLRRKALEDIYFSDKAQEEMNYLFEKLRDMFSEAAGMLLAGDAFIAGYVGRTGLSVSKSAGAFAALHEERLREGICLPRASSVYLSLLEGVKAVAWHLREMIRDFLE